MIRHPMAHRRRVVPHLMRRNGRWIVLAAYGLGHEVIDRHLEALAFARRLNP